MFGSSLKSWLHSVTSPQAAVSTATLDDVRHQILAALADCHGNAADRVRIHVSTLYSGTDLLLLRGDIYQLVAREHCEAEARRRLNDLLPALNRWAVGAGLSRI